METGIHTEGHYQDPRREVILCGPYQKQDVIKEEFVKEPVVGNNRDIQVTDNTSHADLYLAVRYCSS